MLLRSRLDVPVELRGVFAKMLWTSYMAALESGVVDAVDDDDDDSAPSGRTPTLDDILLMANTSRPHYLHVPIILAAALLPARLRLVLDGAAGIPMCGQMITA